MGLFDPQEPIDDLHFELLAKYPDPVERKLKRAEFLAMVQEMKRRMIEEDRARLGHEPDYD